MYILHLHVDVVPCCVWTCQSDRIHCIYCQYHQFFPLVEVVEFFAYAVNSISAFHFLRDSINSSVQHLQFFH
jgi:hypothetical protein